MTIYKDYDQAALDDQYNNRKRIPDFAPIVQSWEQRSEQLRQRVNYVADLPYGLYSRERLDIFPAGQAPAPVQVFFHGGYWQSFSRDTFHFVGEGFLEQGIMVVYVNYPLGPQASMDEIVASCRRSLVWLYHHLSEHGGDPEKIYISGHSAGGHLVGMLLTTDWSGLAVELPRDLIKGGCAISGLFNLIPIQRSYVNDKLGMDEAMAQRNSPLYLAPGCASPLIVSVGELESPEYHAQSNQFAGAWSKQGTPVTELILPEANHFTVLEHLSSVEAALHRAILADMNS
jgi:arylformamidase